MQDTQPAYVAQARAREERARHALDEARKGLRDGAARWSDYEARYVAWEGAERQLRTAEGYQEWRKPSRHR